MQYNLAKYTQTASNTTEGDLSLTTDDIITILNNTDANVPMPASGTTSGTLILDSDLGARAHTGEIQYYFDSPASSGTVASGIKFYYRNESFEVYTSLDTYYNGSYYYTTVSGDSAPRHIRVEHTVVSGTGGYLNGFQVLNDDTYVAFGESGGKTNHHVNLSLENALVEIDEMYVQNRSPASANAKLIIEPQNTAADDILSISTTSDGPWYGVYRDEDKITGSDMWTSGTMDGVLESNNVLRLADQQAAGTYTTRIIKLDEYQNLTFNVMSYDYPTIDPEIEFFDDFSEAGVNWHVVRWYRYQLTYVAGYIDYWNSSGNGGYFELQTNKLDYNYGEDWELTFKYIYQHSTGIGQRTYFLWPKDNFYLRNSGASAADLVVNGVSNDLTPLKDWLAGKGVWHNVKMRRNFTRLSFKIWPTASGEPNDWMWEGYIQPEEVDLPFVAGIKLYGGADIDPAADHVYYDDFKITKRAASFPTDGTIIATEAIDTTENIEVRSSNSDPLPRESYIWMSGTYSPAYKYTNHSWVTDSTLAEESDDWGTWGRTSNYWEYWHDSVRDDEYIVDKPFYTAGTTGIYFRIRRKDGALYSTTITNTGYVSDCFYSTYKLSPDRSGGFWINFFLSRGNINNGIYYLRYYNSTMGLVYNRQTDAGQGTFLYDMDAAYDTDGHLWYNDSDLSTIFKINSGGTILASYLATEGTRGILSLPDGGCWFIQDQALTRLDTYGEPIDVIELPTDLASYVYSDLNGGFWLHAGQGVYHLNPDGTEDFHIVIPNLYHITVINSGVITKEHDGSITNLPQASYVSKDHKKIVRTWAYPRTEGEYEGTFDYNRYGARSHTYDDLVDDHASHFPIAADTGWDNSEWTTVSLRDYNFTNEQYHQIRFTLRGETSWNSPEVYGLWTQRAIELPNIYPGNYGTFYLKSDVTYLAPQDVGNYTSKIRAYWLLNIE